MDEEINIVCNVMGLAQFSSPYLSLSQDTEYVNLLQSTRFGIWGAKALVYLSTSLGAEVCDFGSSGLLSWSSRHWQVTRPLRVQPSAPRSNTLLYKGPYPLYFYTPDFPPHPRGRSWGIHLMDGSTNKTQLHVFSPEWWLQCSLGKRRTKFCDFFFTWWVWTHNSEKSILPMRDECSGKETLQFSSIAFCIKYIKFWTLPYHKACNLQPTQAASFHPSSTLFSKTFLLPSWLGKTNPRLLLQTNN